MRHPAGSQLDYDESTPWGYTFRSCSGPEGYCCHARLQVQCDTHCLERNRTRNHYGHTARLTQLIPYPVTKSRLPVTRCADKAFELAGTCFCCHAGLQVQCGTHCLKRNWNAMPDGPILLKRLLLSTTPLTCTVASRLRGGKVLQFSGRMRTADIADLQERCGIP